MSFIGKFVRTDSINNTLCLQKIGVKNNDFISYVVCPACNTVYEYENCVVKVPGKKVSKDCCHVAYPNHPHVSRRKTCGAKLLKTVKKGNGYNLIPIKVYPYFPLKIRSKTNGQTNLFLVEYYSVVDCDTRLFLFPGNPRGNY